MTKSLGIVIPELVAFETPLDLERGGTLPRYDLMVETYGTLDTDRSNAVLVCHALAVITMPLATMKLNQTSPVGGITILDPVSASTLIYSSW